MESECWVPPGRDERFPHEFSGDWKGQMSFLRPEAMVPETGDRKVAPLDNLRARSVKGGVVSLTCQGLQFVLQIGSAVVLARLLQPGDFGVVAMVTSITSFVYILGEGGLSIATVQSREISNAQVSALFWINVGVSMTLALTVVGVGPLLSWFYHERRLSGIAMVVAITFAIRGLMVQHQALLRREMRFVALGTSNIGAICAGAVCSISLAISGFGYWALVWGMVVTEAARCLQLWIWSAWIPGRFERDIGIGSMVAFGGQMTLGSLMSQFARSLDNLLIGWRYGDVSLGHYSRSQTIMIVPVSQFLAPLTGVMEPLLSRLQDDRERYRKAFMNAYWGVGVAIAPVFLICAILAEQMVMILFGEKWLDASPIFAWLSIVGAFMPLGYAVNWLFATQGRGKEMLTMMTFNSIVIVIAFLAGLPFGPVGVAAAFALSILVRMPLQFHFAGKTGHIRTEDLWKGFGEIVPIGVTAACCTLLVRDQVQHWPLLNGAMSAALAGLSGATALAIILPFYRRRFLLALSLFRNKTGERVSPQESSSHSHGP
ncbi:MAG: lipopolysaccharide biosynthesis protein [Verrucomicrobiales bacterium]